MDNNDKIYFIDSEMIRDRSVVNLTTSSDIINEMIKETQNLYIKRDLGNDIYDKLVNEYSEYILTDWVTPEYERLLEDYVRPAMVNYILFELSDTMYLNYEDLDIEKLELKIEYTRERYLSKYQDFIEMANQYIDDNEAIFLDQDQSFRDSKSFKRRGIAFPEKNSNTGGTICF